MAALIAQAAIPLPAQPSTSALPFQELHADSMDASSPTMIRVEGKGILGQVKAMTAEEEEEMMNG
jgi:hypothetical protein